MPRPQQHRKRFLAVFTTALLIVALSLLCALYTLVFFENPSTVVPIEIKDTDNSTAEYELAQQDVPGPLTTAIIENFNLDYDIPPEAQNSGTVRIPVLTYHHLAPLPSNPKTRDYFVSPEMFEQQLAYLNEKNYKTLTPQEFYDQLASGVNPTQKSVLLTFDDGNYNNYSNAYPLLLKYGLKATFFVPAGRKGISNSQLREMSDNGMSIEPHGKTHMLLKGVTAQGVLNNEIGSAKTIIESITGKKVTAFCYPGCEYNGAVTKTLGANGYLTAFSCGKSIDHTMRIRYVLSRMHVYNDMENFKSILSGKWYYPIY